jgi:glycosyltransferase involved in cell wall biosynthesis
MRLKGYFVVVKKNILFDGTPLIGKHLSGVGVVLLETLKALDSEYYAKKYDLYVFLPFNETSVFKKRHSFKYIKLRTLPFPHKFLSLFSRMRFAPPLDIFLGSGTYIFENYRNWPLVFKKSRSLTYVHDVAFKIFPEYIEPNNLNYLNKYAPLWLKRASKIITVSQSSKNEVEQFLKVGDVSVVKNAVDTSLFYPRTQGEIKSARQKWGLSKNYFLFLGNIEPRKNLTTLVKAFAKYEKAIDNQDALFLVGGDGWNNADIYESVKAAQAEGASVIKNSKFVPDSDLPSLMSGAIALVLPSWHEGFGLPAVQALACGTPVVVSNLPSLHEAVGSNQERAIFFNPDSVKELAQALADVKRKKHGVTCVPTWQESVKSLEALIDVD